jgi:hypothetical protein
MPTHQFLYSDCHINNVSVQQLFEHYSKAKTKNKPFLYPKKFNHIKDYIKSDIINNWEAMLSANENLMWIASCHDPEGHHFSSVTFWRSTLKGWFGQHLTSTLNKPHVTMKVLLFAQNKAITDNLKTIAETNETKYLSCQNWYNPYKKYPNRLYNNMKNYSGHDYSDKITLRYRLIHRSQQEIQSHPLITTATEQDNHIVYSFALKIRGKIYADAEDFHNDLLLSAIDKEYNKVGLSRKRFILLAWDNKKQNIQGAAFIYRGPFALNFSLLENRCDLLIDPQMDYNAQAKIIKALIQQASHYYDSNTMSKHFSFPFPSEYFPVVSESHPINIIDKCFPNKGKRVYNQNYCIWGGFEGWFRRLHDQYNIYKLFE